MEDEGGHRMMRMMRKGLIIIIIKIEVKESKKAAKQNCYARYGFFFGMEIYKTFCVFNLQAKIIPERGGIYIHP